METPTWTNYDTSNALTAKLKQRWEQYNGIYGSYRVTDSQWVGLGVNDLIERNIYQASNTDRYLFVKWTNMKNSANANDYGRADLFIMLDTSYMNQTMLDTA